MQEHHLTRLPACHGLNAWRGSAGPESICVTPLPSRRAAPLMVGLQLGLEQRSNGRFVTVNSCTATMSSSCGRRVQLVWAQGACQMPPCSSW